MNESKISRREVLIGVGAAAGLAACGQDTRVIGKHSLGVALVGIGNLATSQVLPALQLTRNCHLAGLVSRSRDKLRDLGSQHGVPGNAQYTYDDFDRIAENPDIDFAYILLPNGMHAEFSVRGMQAGKHVLCEKPLAVSVEQGESMLAASTATGKQLAVAYRQLFSPHHREMVHMARRETYGHLKLVQANIGFGIKRDDWRLVREIAGGGALLEQGVYAVQAARNLIGGQPTEVMGHEAKTDLKRFAEVDESVFWAMRFPGDVIAHCGASYSMEMNRLWCGATDGFFELEPAFTYKNLAGRSSEGSIDAPDANQFVGQLDNFALGIIEGIAPKLDSAEEGIRDLRVIRAVYESIQNERAVAVS